MAEMAELAGEPLMSSVTRKAIDHASRRVLPA
jgi:hypothetical protein